MSCNAYNYKAEKEKFLQNIAQDFIFKNVTLVGDDGQVVKTHKLVLCAGSKLLNKLLLDVGNAAGEPWIHLSGVNHVELNDIVTYLYTGEVVATETNIANFLKVAELLDIKSVFDTAPETLNPVIKPRERNSASVEETEAFAASTIMKNKDNQPSDNDENLKESENLEWNSHEIDVVSDENDIVSDENDVVSEENDVVINEYTLDNNEMMSKKDGLWECEICEKTFIKKFHAKCHVAIHNKDTNIFKCHQCSTSFGTQDYLRNHKLRMHSKDRFQCPRCGKAEMTRQQFKSHKYQSKSCGSKFKKQSSNSDVTI